MVVLRRGGKLKSECPRSHIRVYKCPGNGRTKDTKEDSDSPIEVAQTAIL